MKRVLVVEDEQDVADLVADILGFEGYTVQLSTGERALEDTLAFTPDVVLLDLMMPGVDGFEVARRLRARATTRSIPIVVMTAMHDVPSRASEVGTRHFLAKPFDIEELVNAVEGAVSREP